jgi:hypothetical protein
MSRLSCPAPYASAFLDLTGQEHWDLLIRRTALDGRALPRAPYLPMWPCAFSVWHSKEEEEEEEEEGLWRRRNVYSKQTQEEEEAKKGLTHSKRAVVLDLR